MWFWKKKKAPEWNEAWPEEVKTYLRKDFRKSHESYVVFDLETTGLDPKKDKILSFAFLRIEKDIIQIQDRMEGFIQHPVLSDTSTTGIHHVVHSDLQNGIPPQEFLNKTLAFIGNSILVGHHMAFDVACINELLMENFGLEIRNKTRDTAKIASRLERALPDAYNATKKYKTLDELCEQYGIRPEARHSASGDTFTTAMLFLKIKKLAKKRKIDV